MFTIAKYESRMLLLCDKVNVFIDASCNSNIHLHLLGLFKLIKTTLRSAVYLQYGIVIQRVVTRKGLPSVQ